MAGSDVVLAIVVAAALAFGFTNGFRDTASLVGISISTRALRPKPRIALASILNLAGAFLSLAVASTVANDLVESAALTTNMVFAAVIGAIAWNIATWYAGLPSSSSHALLGGIVGAALFGSGADAVQIEHVVGEVLIPALVSPPLALALATFGVIIAYRAVGRRSPGPVKRGFRRGQWLSGGLLALAHGSNDAQKTMGVMTLALIAHGDIAPGDVHVPAWVVASAAVAIAAGTYAGGWRSISTRGRRIHRLDPAQGFAAEMSGAVVTLAATAAGFPLSTTHTTSGALIGSGAAKRLSSVRWGIAGNILAAWVLTFPAAGLTAGLIYGFTRLFGTGATGPVIVSILAVGLLLVLVQRRSRENADPPAWREHL